MPQHRFGKTDRLAHEPFQPCSEGEMGPFNLVRRWFAHDMMCGLEMTSIPVCTIGVAMTHTQWGSQRFYLSADGILLGPPYRRHYHARAMSHGRPEPALVRVLPNNAPHFINFSSTSASSTVWSGMMISCGSLVHFQ
jgi:hypothetical protein